MQTKRPHPTRLRTGFTLIELLVVVAIIALLISILLPSLSAAREKARFVKCAANLHSLITTTRIYADENKDMIPFPNWILWSHGRELGVPGWLYGGKARRFLRKLERRRAGQKVGLIWPYIKDEAVYRCPSHVVDFDWRAGGRSADNFSWTLTSYLMNGAMADFPPSTDYPHSTHKIEKYRPDAVVFWEPPWLERGYDETIGWNDGSSYPSERFTTRHGGVATVAHIDGHTSVYDDGKWKKQLEFAPSPLWCAAGTENGGPPH